MGVLWTTNKLIEVLTKNDRAIERKKYPKNLSDHARDTIPSERHDDEYSRRTERDEQTFRKDE